MKIHKVLVPLDRQGHQVKLGMTSRPLAIGFQGNELVMWYEFKPDPCANFDERWNVCAVWTGQDFIPYGNYVGTATSPEGLVYHVYAGRL